jgi:hypothetical protein
LGSATVKLGCVISDFCFPARFETELKERRAAVPITSLSREFFCVSSGILGFDWNDVFVAVSVEQIDAKPLKLRSLQLIVDCPQNHALHR